MAAMLAHLAAGGRDASRNLRPVAWWDGEGREIAEKAAVNYWTVAQYGSVARACAFCDRS
jgi:hypothetical protein